MTPGTCSEALPAWLSRGLADLFPAAAAADPDQRLADRLAEAAGASRPLRIKLGIDPTGTEIQIGRAHV